MLLYFKNGNPLIKFMMSDFSPVPFVFINMFRQLLEGRRAIQTVVISGEIENLSFDAMLHADLHYHVNSSIL